MGSYRPDNSFVDDVPSVGVSSLSAGEIVDDFDPAALIEKAVTADLDPSVFDQISERDLPRAKNWLEWCLSKEFAGLNTPPFPRQIQIAINFLQEYCPYCSDMAFVQDMYDQKITEIYDRVQMTDFGTCPKCAKTRLDALADGHWQAIRTELDAVLGMRSGKSTLAAGMMAPYVLHKQLMYGDPSRFYSLMSNQTLHMTFTAITAGQAYDTLWTPFRERYSASPWFVMYNKFLTNECKRLSIDPLRMLDTEKDTFVWYGGQKNLVCSFSSADMRAIRGRTRFLTAIDELGWFDQNQDSGKVRANADETHAALEKSLLTIRGASQKMRDRGIVDVLPGYAFNISSPSQKNDKIMRLLAEAKDDPTKYAAHYATWEVNPDIPLSSLRSEMRNRTVFDRDYGAIPPLANSPFLEDDKAVDKMQSEVKPIITWMKKIHTDELGDQTAYIEVGATTPDKSFPTILTVDTGFSNNSFAVAISRYNRDHQAVENLVALELAPIETGNTKLNVNFPLMFEKCILPLCDAYNVIYAVYDRWNSIDQVQRLKERKIHAEQYSLVWQDFINFRTKVYDGVVKIPKAEKTLKEIKSSTSKFDALIDNAPYTHLFVQLLTVREVGRKVTKPLGGTDDLFRCLVLASTYIFDPELTRKFEASGTGRGSGQKVLGVMRGNFTGSRSIATKAGSSTAIAVRKGFRNSQ